MAALRTAISLYLDGHGGSSIAKKLNSDGISYTGRPIAAAHFYKIIKARTLLGVKEIAVDGETYSLQDYYPAIVTPEVFDKLQATRNTRPRASGGNIPGIFTGIGACFCGYCGAAMSGINMQYRAKADGRILDGHRRLICVSHSLKQDCPVGSSCSLGVVERALLRYCSDYLTMGELDGQGKVYQALQKKLATAEAELAGITQKIERLAAALLETNEPPLAIMRMMRELEGRQQELDSQRRALGAEMRAEQRQDQEQLLAEWSKVTCSVDSLEYDARVRARTLVSKTFARIDVFVKGMDAHKSGAQALTAARLAGHLSPAPKGKPAPSAA